MPEFGALHFAPFARSGTGTLTLGADYLFEQVCPNVNPSLGSNLSRPRLSPALSSESLRSLSRPNRAALSLSTRRHGTRKICTRNSIFRCPSSSCYLHRTCNGRSCSSRCRRFAFCCPDLIFFFSPFYLFVTSSMTRNGGREVGLSHLTWERRGDRHDHPSSVAL